MKPNAFVRFSSCLALGAALFLLASVPVRAQVSPNSPLGTWDCTVSGARNGIAYLTFASDETGGTLTGLEVVVPKPPPSAPRPSLIAGDIGSNGLGIRPPSTNLLLNFFGSLPLNGAWGFDNKGRTIGFFTESQRGLIRIVCSTTPVVITQIITTTQTNLDGTVTNIQTATSFTTHITTCATNFSQSGFTNTVSFTGVVVPGKRLTLVCTGPLGSVTFRGVPAVPLADLSGAWYGVKRQNGFSNFEFFNLIPIQDFPNAYLVTGAGPNYSYQDGIALLSSQKKIAIALDINNGSGFETIRTVLGPFNSQTLQGSTVGVEGPPGPSALTNQVSFQVIKRATVP